MGFAPVEVAGVLDALGCKQRGSAEEIHSSANAFCGCAKKKGNATHSRGCIEGFCVGIKMALIV